MARKQAKKQARKQTKKRVKRRPKTRAKRRRARRDPLEQYITAAALALGLPVALAWEPAVRANLAAVLRMARQYSEFPLPDDAEPAPVFEA